MHIKRKKLQIDIGNQRAYLYYYSYKHMVEENNMLVKVTAENFKFFDEIAELTIVSSAKIRKNNEHKVTIKRINL